MRGTGRLSGSTWIRIALVVAVTVAAIVAFQWFVRPTSPPPTVTMNGANLTITYLRNSPEIFGPPHQNACSEHLLLQQIGPDCPITLTSGTQYTFWMFVFAVVPFNVSSAFINATLYSPIPFWQNVCGASNGSETYSHFSSQSQQILSGSGCAWQVNLDMPSPAPSIAGGFSLVANLTVNEV